MICRKYLENFLPLFLSDKLYHHEATLFNTPVNYFSLKMSI